MRGIRKHSRQDRLRVIAEVTPVIRERFGENLVALAAQASFARGEDSDYSDLELIAFVRRMPAGKRWGGLGRIRDGMLVELVWTTGEIYLEDVRGVTGNWYAAGSDVLLPIINEEFIKGLNDYRVENLAGECLKRAAAHWHEVQEATAKVLNAVVAHHREGLPLLAFDMLRHMLIVLSFLNQTPYVTFARFVTQAKAFGIQPEGFGRLLNLVARADYRDLQLLRATVSEVFTQFETLFEARGVVLYDDGTDWGDDRLPEVG
jgi:hypothetical protein